MYPTLKETILLVSKKLKSHTQFYVEDDDPEDSDHYIDWGAWTLPTLKVAFFRQTGPSCRVHDWKDFEKDCITWKEADDAKRYTDRYIREAIRKGHYKSRGVQCLAGAFSAMEGYGLFEDYVSNGMEILCTATTSAGKSYAKGNYFNSTKKLSFPEPSYSE